MVTVACAMARPLIFLCFGINYGRAKGLLPSVYLRPIAIMIEVERLNLVNTVDPRTDVNSAARRAYAVLEGPKDQAFIQVSPDGGVSNSSMTYTINPTSQRVFINRRGLIRNKYLLTFTGVSGGAGQTLLQCAGMDTAPGVSAGNAFYDAPRAFPIANSCTSIQVSMANDRLSQNLNLYFRALTRYHNDVHQQEITQGMTPTMLDQSQAYSDLDGFARSPLRGYGDNAYQCPRGGFYGCRLLSNTSTGVADTATVEIDATEFFWLSPFLFEEGAEDTGFIGIQNMMLTIQLGGRGVGVLSGLAASLWSHSSGSPSTISAVTADVLESQVFSSYLTPNADMPIPEINNYPYSDLVVYPTQSANAVAAGASTLIQMNNIQLNSVPSRILLWVAPQDASNSITSTDTYFRIDNVDVSFNNVQSILSNATTQDLYQIAAKNKTNLSWTQWNREVGSVLALDLGTDIPIDSRLAVGSMGSFNLQLRVRCTNLSAGAVLPTLSCLVMSEGVLTINQGKVLRSVGILSAQEVKEVRRQPQVPHVARDSIYGGGFWDSVRSFLRNVGRPVLDVARKVVPAFYPAAAPALEGVSEFAKSQGYGLVGGKKMSRAQLLKALR